MPMPYTLTKGPLFLVMEQTLNDPAARATVLEQLRSNVRLPDMPWVVNGPGSTVAVPGVLRTRLFDDWFGYRDDGRGGWDPQPAFVGQSTGYWVGYYGNTEAVLREGLVRTIEVALGLAHDDPVSKATRAWSIETAWKCPNPWFEVWVTWKQLGDGAGEGHVTMVICTPPDTNNRLVTRAQFPPTLANEPVTIPLTDPRRATANEGMWLVAHDEHRPTMAFLTMAAAGAPPEMVEGDATLQGTPQFRMPIPVPSTFWVDSNSPDDVVVVAPPRSAGGI